MQIEIGSLGGMLVVVGRPEGGDTPIAYTLDVLVRELGRMAMECDEADKESDALVLRTVSALLDELVVNASVPSLEKVG